MCTKRNRLVSLMGYFAPVVLLVAGCDSDDKSTKACSEYSSSECNNKKDKNGNACVWNETTGACEVKDSSDGNNQNSDVTNSTDNSNLNQAATIEVDGEPYNAADIKQLLNNQNNNQGPMASKGHCRIDVASLCGDGTAACADGYQGLCANAKVPDGVRCQYRQGACGITKGTGHTGAVVVGILGHNSAAVCTNNPTGHARDGGVRTADASAQCQGVVDATIAAVATLVDNDETRAGLCHAVELRGVANHGTGGANEVRQNGDGGPGVPLARGVVRDHDAGQATGAQAKHVVPCISAPKTRQSCSPVTQAVTNSTACNKQTKADCEAVKLGTGAANKRACLWVPAK